MSAAVSTVTELGKSLKPFIVQGFSLLFGSSDSPFAAVYRFQHLLNAPFDVFQ